MTLLDPRHAVFSCLYCWQLQAFHDDNHNFVASEADKHSLSISEAVYRFLVQS